MKFTKHLEYGLPEYFAIKTNNGKEDNWRQAIEKFNEIFESSWGGSSYKYYGYCGYGPGTNMTDSWDEIDMPKNVFVLTPTEFLNIVNHNTPQTTQQMKHELQQGDALENVTAEQWEVIKILAPQYGAEIYSATLKDGYPREDFNNQLVFDVGKLQGSYVMTRSLSFDQFILALMGKRVVKPTTVKLNDRYNAVVTKDEVTVGCQTFNHEVIKQLYDAISNMK